uniref:Heterokaryon incompatibility domain-containing protein n=1 Tax=Bionectria ochroleuca TaxID=29856 RepID=A0A0B7KQ74_BIOOC
MRLLNTDTLKLEFFQADVPQYAVLSHRWEEEEVTYEDIRTSRDVAQLKGYSKLRMSAQVAKASGYDYIWIDTCCIDKSSSAELSEAINSMFKWYKASAECIAYLSDIEGSRSILESRWFSRGWTLQEMIAPRLVNFYDRYWEPRGSKSDWKAAIQEHTGIPSGALDGTVDLNTIPICCKMSWAAGRVTTRGEDVAYCLLGIFNVNMPLLYGEGQGKAYRRLQETIVRENDDESIFAWTAPPGEILDADFWGLLAPSPAYFRGSRNYSIPRFKTWRTGDPVEITNRGLKVSLLLCPVPGDKSRTQFLAVLNCTQSTEHSTSASNSFSITLQKLSEFEDQYARVRPDKIRSIDGMVLMSQAQTATRPIFVRSDPRPTDPVLGFCADKSQKVQFNFPTNSQQGPVVLKGFTNIELEASKPWLCQQVTDSRQVYSVELSEDKASVEPQVETGSLKSRKLNAILRLHCRSFLLEEADGKFQARCSPFQPGPSYQDPYLLLGFEALPPNAMGTPSAFLKPWYAFSPSSEPEATQAIISSENLLEQSVHTAPGHSQFRIELQATTLNFRTFYEVNVVSYTGERGP